MVTSLDPEGNSGLRHHDDHEMLTRSFAQVDPQGAPRCSMPADPQLVIDSVTAGVIFFAASDANPVVARPHRQAWPCSPTEELILATGNTETPRPG